MPQISILSGIYASGLTPEMRVSYPRNRDVVPLEHGISAGYLRPSPGIVQSGTGPGPTRGGIVWNGVLYRVMGTKLVSITEAGAVTVLGDVGAGGAVRMDYSFDRLIVPSGRRLYYWDGTTLTQVTDPDLGDVISAHWIAGYTMTTDGTSLVVSDLSAPTSVDPLKYGGAEADPDPIMAVDELFNEAYALGRYTIEVFENVGGQGFPFARKDGAQVNRGVIGTHAYVALADTFAFLGSGRDEAPSVYLMTPGNTQRIATDEVDIILQGYTEAQLAEVVMEKRIGRGHQQLLIHLPDQCLVYDLAASAALKQHVWTTRTTSLVGPGQYRARHLVWAYDAWQVGDPAGPAIGTLSDAVSSHWGETIGWDFSTSILYADSRSAIVHELELVCLSGRVALGDDPVIWTSYSKDGVTWGQERATRAGRRGQMQQRICWRGQGTLGHWRVQRFRGTSDAHLSIARLEAQIEPLFAAGA